jgi:DNA-binding MarR family transcriptional regulator
MTARDAGPPPPLDDQICYAIYSAGIAIQRIYKPLLDELGLTYPQYLVMNVLWREDSQTVGAIAEHLALEPSTLTPLLKRLETSGFVTRTRNPENERQVVIALAEAGRGLRARAGCLGQALLEASGRSSAELGQMKSEIKALRDAIYSEIGGWKPQS